MPNEPTTEALAAYTALIAGVSFPTITDDIAGTDFNLPVQTGILYDAPAELNVDDLTDTNVGGTGVFDKIMTSLRSHLSEEYDKGTITAQQYAEVYIAMTQTALGSAVQFTIAANSATYQNALVQMQARAAENTAIAARLEALRGKYAVVSAQAEAENMKANYALTKMNIGVQDITYTRIESEVALTDSNQGIAAYQLSDILPEEKRKLTYEIDSVLQAQVDKINYETDTIMAKQALVLDQDVRIKTFQRDNIMPAQEDVLKEQHEVQRAQTMDIRSDAITSISGAIGKQKELYTEQISSYQKDARYKAAKLWVDGWITQKSLDEALLPPNQFTNTEIDEVLQTLKSGLSLGTV